jgi:hypothetical protein
VKGPAENASQSGVLALPGSASSFAKAAAVQAAGLRITGITLASPRSWRSSARCTLDIVAVGQCRGSIVAVGRGQKAGAHQQQHDGCLLQIRIDASSPLLASRDVSVCSGIDQALPPERREMHPQVCCNLVSMGIGHEHGAAAS